MAVVANQYDPNNPNGQNQGGGGTVMNSTGGGSTGSTGSTPGGSTPGGATSNAPRPASGGAPNIQQYLNANQGAGQQLASGIQNNVQNQANQFNQNLDSAQNSLNQQYTPLNENLGQKGQNTINTAFQNPQALLDAYNQNKAASTNTPNINNTNTPDQQQAIQDQAGQYDQFQKLNSGGYNQDISNFGTQAQNFGGNLSGQLAGIQQQTGLGNNELGRSQLLQNTVGQNGYNQGQQTLDNLFLQAQPGAANQLSQGLGQIKDQTSTGFNNAASDVQNKLQALQGMSSADQQQIKNLFMNGQTGATDVGQMGLGQIGNAVNQQYTDQAAQSKATQDAFGQAFQSGQYTPDQLQALGLTQGQSLWGMTGADVAKGAGYQNNAIGTGAAGLAQASTPEQMARYNALNQLAGGANGPAQASIFGDAATAGGYSPYTLANGANGLSNSINARAQDVGINKVNDMITQMQQQGYFGGMSSGGGMRSADPNAQRRQDIGAQLLSLQAGSKQDANGKGGADPNQYYNQVMQAVQNGWGGIFGANAASQMGGMYGQLANYGNTLGAAQNDRVNTDPNAKNPNDIGNTSGTKIYS